MDERDDLERVLALHGGTWTWGGPATEPVACGCGEWTGCIADHRGHVAEALLAYWHRDTPTDDG